ncbi:MAG TPA: hypothetical protein PLT92_13705 [Ignavibacteriaceae bacterium]|nr:hypothetical protein [Ignavibacteriaceae bacterium]
MKKLYPLFIVILIVLALFTISVPVFAQEVGEEISQVNFKDSFESLPALSAFVLIATGWIAQLIIKLKWDLKLEAISKGWKQYLSWGTGLLLSVAGYLLQWGLFYGAPWYYIFIYGLTAALIANGLFKWELLKTVLEAIKLLPKPKTE